MIKNVTYEESKGRLYAIVTRDTPSRGDNINITIRNADDEFTHTKFLPNEGAEVSIDLTPYCKAYITGKLSDVMTGSMQQDSLGANITVGVRVHDSYAEEYSGYEEKFGILTKLPYLQVSRANTGDIDTLRLGMCIPDDAEMYINNEVDGNQSIRGISERIFFYAISGNAKNIRLYDKAGIYDDKSLLSAQISVRTVPRGMNTRRLIWRNEVGGIDAWSFEFLREKTFATTSEVFYSTLNGYTRTNRQYERLNVVETREVDERVADALAYITASPDVYLWDYETNKPIPIDIVTEECRTYSDTELTSIQIAYRPKERETL